MWMKLYISLGLISIECLVAIVCYDYDEYCYSDDSTPYGYFGTKTPYDNVRSKEITSPNDCSTYFIWSLISHGTRHVIDSDGLSPKSLSDIRDEIVKNHEQDGRGELCEEDLDLLKNWKFPWNKTTYGELAEQGKVDMENLAVRWERKFPAFINQRDKFQFQSSSAKLSGNSAIAFRGRIYGTEPHIKLNDELFKVGTYTNASENKELNEFTKSSLIDDICYEISVRLGYENTLKFDFVIKLYRQCALEKANKPSAKSAFCTAFTADSLEVLEYYDDLDTYYAFGYGTSNNTNRACSLAQDLYKKLDVVRSYDDQRGAFYFGQGYNVLTLLTKLGMFFDSRPLKHDNFAYQESREWRTSFINPFASNFVAVMYNCSNERKVSFYVNEGRVQYPGCDKGVCSWSLLKEKFKNEILKECPAGKESSATRLLSVNMLTVIHAVAFIFIFNSWCKFTSV